MVSLVKVKPPSLSFWCLNHRQDVTLRLRHPPVCLPPHLSVSLCGQTSLLKHLQTDTEGTNSFQLSCRRSPLLLPASFVFLSSGTSSSSSSAAVHCLPVMSLAAPSVFNLLHSQSYINSHFFSPSPLSSPLLIPCIQKNLSSLILLALLLFTSYFQPSFPPCWF